MRGKIKTHGQGSTEYLIILAVAILIGIVVVSLLGGFIKIGGGTSEKQVKTYWKSANIGIPSWSIGQSGATLIIQNNFEFKISVNYINATSASGTSITIAIDQVLAPGETYRVVNNTLNCSPPGSGYSYDIIFNFDNLDFSLTNQTWVGKEKLSGNCLA